MTMPTSENVTMLTDAQILSAAIEALPEANPFDTRYEFTESQVIKFGRILLFSLAATQPTSENESGAGERDAFEVFAQPILGDNPTWKESGDGELG